MADGMVVPDPPDLAPLEQITPSIYDASLTCLAKAAWVALGDTRLLPQHPAAILGSAFHMVVAAAHKGKLSVTGAGDHSAARALFDRTAQKLHLSAHRLVKLKFPSADRFPFYNMHRERAAIMATSIAASRSSSVRSIAPVMRLDRATLKTEARLSSRDGYLVGRADRIDARSGVVVDYKTGHVAGGEAPVVSNSEARQLRLYTYLAAENGIDVRTGAVVRGDGQRCEISIPPADAEAEANCARKQLGRLNAAVVAGASFRDLASPSAKNCSFCPCLPFCSPFWAKARPDWVDDCGTHVEGEIVAMESLETHVTSLTTLVLSRQAGTVSEQRVSVEQIPNEWLHMDGLCLPHIGDTLRVVHGRQVETGDCSAVVRPDKTLTAVWRLRTDDVDPPKVVCSKDT